MDTLTEHAARTVRVTVTPDDDPDLSWLEQDCWNDATETEPEGYGRRRLAEYGETWSMVGIVVDVLCEHGGIVDSASLWGIEDDSARTYFGEVVGELCAELGLSDDLTAQAAEQVAP